MQPSELFAAEQAVIGSLMLDSDVILEVRDVLLPSDFADGRHGLLFSAACALADKQAPIDPLTLRAQLSETGALQSAGGVEYISDLPALTPSVTSVSYYADLVASAGRLRRLASIGERLAGVGASPRDAGEIADAAMAEIYTAVSSAARSKTLLSAAEVSKRTWDHLSRAQDHGTGVTGIQSGFLCIDRLTSGWQPGDLAVIAARPGVGKTSLGIAMARGAAQSGRAAVFVSMEMLATAVWTRLVASTGKIDESRLRTGRLSPDEWSKAAITLDGLSKLPLMIDEPPSLSIPELRSRVRLLQRQGKCDVLFVDQLGNLTPTTKENRTQAVSEFSAGLKRIARELSIPVIAMHQLNRDGAARTEEQRPELHHLRDSGTVEQDCDVALLLHRPWSSREGRTDGPIEIHLAKTRRGGAVTVRLQYTGTQTRFAAVDQSDVIPPERPRYSETTHD
jgi:replicative DNA helicase